MINTIGHQTHHLLALASGDQSSCQVFSINGQKKGPKVHIQANVHGAEVQGNLVLVELLNFFQDYPLKGQMTLIPMANPLSLNNHQGGHTQGRFDGQSGENWNRQYIDVIKTCPHEGPGSLVDFVKNHRHLKSLALKEAFKDWLLQALENYQHNLTSRHIPLLKIMPLFLQQMASKADIVLDLHTGPVACDYLYACHSMKERALKMSFPHTLLIPDEFAGAMDEACFMPWAHLERECQLQGLLFKSDFDAFTVELGSEENIHQDLGKIQAARLLHYLAFKDCLDHEHAQKFMPLEKIKPTKQYSTTLSHYKRYFAPSGGLVQYLVKPGQAFEKGETLAQVLNFRQYPDLFTPLKAVTSGILINHHTSASVRQGQAIVQVMENYQTHD